MVAWTACAGLGALQGALDREVGGLVLKPDKWLRTCTDMYLPLEAPAHAMYVATHYQSYPRSSPRADLHPKKVNNLGPMAPRPRQIRNYPRAPSSRRSGLVGPFTTPPIVNYKYMTSTL